MEGRGDVGDGGKVLIGVNLEVGLVLVQRRDLASIWRDMVKLEERGGHGDTRIAGQRGWRR